MRNHNYIVKTLKSAMYIIVALFVGAVMIAGIEKAFLIQEENECMQWQEQAKEFPSFYLTTYQKEQCDRHRIDIDARIDDSQRVY